MCCLFSIAIHKAQLQQATQEQASAAAAANPSVPAASAASPAANASNLSLPSVSQSNIQTHLPAANLPSAVANSVQLQALQKQTTPQVNGQTAAMPYSLYPVQAPGIQYATLQGMLPMYDPKAMLMASASKLKMLPTLATIKPQRHAPY